jgi:hypothetical protein
MSHAGSFVRLGIVGWVVRTPARDNENATREDREDERDERTINRSDVRS